MDARTTTRSSKQALPKLVPSALVKQHAAACGKSRSWHRMCSSGMKPKWLHLSVRGKQGVAAGCADCARASVGGPWAEFQQNPCKVTPYAMKRHEASKAHQAAAQLCAGKAAIAMAPPHSEFQAALTCMRQGGSARQGGVSSDRKSWLRFALSEALLRRARQQLARARCVALFRDERKGRLLVRYRACLDDLTVVSGVLGLKQAEGSGDGLTKVTKMILEEFATPFHDLPRKCSAPSSDAGDLVCYSV